MRSICTCTHIFLALVITSVASPTIWSRYAGKYLQFTNCKNNQFIKKLIMIILLNLHRGTRLSGWLRPAGHIGLCDVRVIIIDKTNVDRPTQREAFWVYKLDTFVPRGLYVRDFD